MSQSKNIHWIAFIILVIAAISSRFIPDTRNFTAVGAAALFSGVVMRDKRYAFLIPITILFISDIFKGFHFSMVPVYGSFVLTVWIGTIVSKRPNWKFIALGSIIGSTLFFLITNLPFWYADLQLYPMTWEGTLASYTAGLEFYRNQLAGDLFYNTVIFGIYFLITSGKKLTPVVLKK